MVDLTEAAVLDWFAPLRPQTHQTAWPPTVRQIERALRVEPLLTSLGAAFAELADDVTTTLPAALTAEPVRHDLQMVLAQLGAARLLRVADWMAFTLPDAHLVISELSQGGSDAAQAINSSLRVLTARATLTRMFSPDRVALLQSSVEAANNPQESP